MRRHAFRHFDPVQSQAESLDEACEQGVNHHDALDAQLDVVKALSRIAPIHREVLVLYYFDDMPTAQMAEALDIAPGTVLSRLARAREALKTALQEPARRPAKAATESFAAVGVIPLRKRAP
ncbi:hypothetical protein SDC9_179947 [bioreactor metagenome]|uniref:RNA polymerase sigma factor 70 region 4 type 2 domain-containing protein n=2 Tax=root TaxID=1 RepID=A0A645H398_9ZZZZ